LTIYHYLENKESIPVLQGEFKIVMLEHSEGVDAINHNEGYSKSFT